MYPPNGKCGDSEETDPDKLHDLKITLEQYQVYPWEQIDEFVEAFLNGADQSNLDPRLDTCVEKYKKLDEDRQVDFKSSAKAFTRLYAFLDAQLSWTRGRAGHIPELPDQQASRPGGGGPVQGSAGCSGNGELPDGAEGSPEHQPSRGGRRDRPGSAHR